MAEQHGPYENRPVKQRRPIPDWEWEAHSPLTQPPVFPIGYSAVDQGIRVVTEKARVEVLDAIAHAHGCGCPRCYRRAETTYAWYSERDKKLKPK